MTTPWAYKNPNQAVELLKRVLLTDSIRWDPSLNVFRITYSTSDYYRIKGTKGEHLIGDAEVKARINADSTLLQKHLDMTFNGSLIEHKKDANELVLRPDDCKESDFKNLVSDSDSLTRQHNAKVYYRGY